MDPWFCLLLKRVKIFSGLFCQLPNYRLRIFWWKKNDIGRAIFTLISINGHYCTMLETLFWPPFLSRTIFSNFYFKNVNVFMFFNFIIIEKFHWESVFSNFGQVTFFTKWKFVFGRHCETKHFLIVLFAYGCFGCIHIWCKFGTKNSYWKVSKMNGFKQIPLVHKQEWKVA